MSPSTAKTLSSALLAAGACLTIFPLIWVAHTALQVGPAQEAALAGWEEPDWKEPARPARAVGQAAASPPGAPSPGLVLTIPRLGLTRFVPEGASPGQLRRYGLGRITWTPTPDHTGVVGIAGHRTTYGAPFFRLGRLREGDEILIDYAGRRFRYTVTERVTVPPHRVDVLNGDPGQRGVALVTCTPIYSAAYRLVVLGRLEEVSPIPAERVN